MKKSNFMLFAMLAAMAMAPAQAVSAAETAPEDSDPSAIVSEVADYTEDDQADPVIEAPVEETPVFAETEEDTITVDDSAEEIPAEEELPEIEIIETPESEITEETEADEETEAEDETETDKETEAKDETEEAKEIESETTEKFEKSPVDLSAFENQKVAEFVVRMYDKFLQRTPDAEGLQHWYDQLLEGKTNGAKITEQFINSKEFISRKLSTDAFLDILYEGILGRTADTAGKQHWTATQDKGVSGNYVASRFITSKEFTNLCANYGIDNGQYPLKQSRDQNINLTEWVNRFYQNCLDRKGDESGLNYWTGHLLDGTRTGSDVISGFLFSKEYLAKKVSNEEFINTIYKTAFGRPADASGLSYWMKRLDDGVSLRYVTGQIILSSEFKRNCNSRGVELGTLKMTENRDKNYKLTAYCNSLYLNILGRKASVTELNELTGKCLSKALNQLTLPSNFFSSSEYKALSKSDESFIRDLYKGLLKRGAGASEVSTQLNSLKSDYNNNREAFLNAIISSKEYINVCSNAAVPIAGNTWLTLGDKKFYYDSYGQIHSGWLRLDGNRYYMDPDNVNSLFTGGWKYLDGYKFYFYDNGVMATDLDDIIGPQASYFIHVYKWGNYIVVFAKDGDNGYIIPCKVMICTTGVNTPTGYYITPTTIRWCTMIGGSQAQWCTQILGDYLFHSVPYVYADNTTLYNESMYNYLGTTRSAGCVRLQAGFAKWVYDNCGAGTLVYIDPDNNEGPFDKPYFETLESWHTWDPTDPTANYLCAQVGCDHKIVLP